MKERPILFSGEMIRAILDGRKTQTRRAIKKIPPNLRPICPYGCVGDRLWVRESAIITPEHWDDGGGTFIHTRLDPRGNRRWLQYLATSTDWDAPREYGLKITPSIFMPRWASRITLEVVEVRVQRLQDISEADAMAEGVEREGNGFHSYQGGSHVAYAITSFASLWGSINAKRGFGWEVNPWVFAISFRRV